MHIDINRELIYLQGAGPVGGEYVALVSHWNQANTQLQTNKMKILK